MHRDHDYPRGESDAARYGDIARALGWGATGGYHSCEFCGNVLGFGSFGVPAGGKPFYAPDMIAHYVTQHMYKPPAEFVAAVLASPSPGTSEYAKAVSKFVVRY